MPDFSLTQMALAPAETPSHVKMNSMLWVAELQRRQYGPFSFSVSDLTASSAVIVLTDDWQNIGGYVTTGGNDWLARKFAVEYRKTTAGTKNYARWENVEFYWDATENGWIASVSGGSQTTSYADGGSSQALQIGTGTTWINLSTASGLNFTVWSMNNQTR